MWFCGNLLGRFYYGKLVVFSHHLYFVTIINYMPHFLPCLFRTSLIPPVVGRLLVRTGCCCHNNDVDGHEANSRNMANICIWNFGEFYQKRCFIFYTTAGIISKRIEPVTEPQNKHYRCRYSELVIGLAWLLLLEPLKWTSKFSFKWSTVL